MAHERYDCYPARPDAKTVNANLHFHMRFLDGVYVADRQGRPRFVPVLIATPAVPLDEGAPRGGDGGICSPPSSPIGQTAGPAVRSGR